jgi:hypothetical protein
MNNKSTQTDNQIQPLIKQYLLNVVKNNIINFTDIAYDKTCKKKHDETYCNYCLLNTNEIFNIKNLVTLKEYFKNKCKDEIKTKFLIRDPTYGYTYMHYLCWAFAKERLRHKNMLFAQEIPSMIEFIANYDADLFKELFEQETIDQPGCTPMHDYIKNLSHKQDRDIKFINFIKKSNINFDIKDMDGNSVNDYIDKKTRINNSLSSISKYQSIVKKEETVIRSKIFILFPNSFSKCKKCNRDYNYVDDLYNIPSNELINKLNLDDISKIISIITNREKVSNIYNTNNSNSNEIKISHLNIINTWKSHIKYAINN